MLPLVFRRLLEPISRSACASVPLPIGERGQEGAMSHPRLNQPLPLSPPRIAGRGFCSGVVVPRLRRGTTTLICFPPLPAGERGRGRGGIAHQEAFLAN